MWPYLAITCLTGAFVLHLWWRRRFLEVQSQCTVLETDLAELRVLQTGTATGAEAERQALFNSMVEGVLVSDSKGRILFVNDALRTMINLSVDPVGRTIIEALRMHEVDALAERALTEHRVSCLELELQGSHPGFFEVNAATVRDRNGGNHGVILVFHDLTRVRHLENTRRDFVANVSHELRTPLALIKGYAETLLEGARDDPKASSRFLEIILKHSNRLEFLINDLLTISELESGRAPMHFGRVELRPLVEQVWEEISAKADTKGVRLQIELAPNLSVKADVDRLRQVFVNLLDNAIKYGPPDGVTRVCARGIDETTVEVRVIDDGPGIPPEAAERVFERFFRLDRARTREQGGTGLGLSIVKHIVQSHSGRVWVQPASSRGSEFCFTLPKARTETDLASGSGS